MKFINLVIPAEEAQVLSHVLGHYIQQAKDNSPVAEVDAEDAPVVKWKERIDRALNEPK